MKDLTSQKEHEMNTIPKHIKHSVQSTCGACGCWYYMYLKNTIDIPEIFHFDQSEKGVILTENFRHRYFLFPVGCSKPYTCDAYFNSYSRKKVNTSLQNWIQELSIQTGLSLEAIFQFAELSLSAVEMESLEH